MAKKSHKPTDSNLVAQNKKARHDYSVQTTYEAGLVLTGRRLSPFVPTGST